MMLRADWSLFCVTALVESRHMTRFDLLQYSITIPSLSANRRTTSLELRGPFHRRIL